MHRKWEETAGLHQPAALPIDPLVDGTHSHLVPDPSTDRYCCGVELLGVLVESGMLLQSARGPIPNVAELVAGEPIKGSWWAHPKSHEIFDALGALCESPDVVRLRLIKGKITLVHRRVWPALVRLAEDYTLGQLAAIHQEHTSSGAHRTWSQPFPEWVPAGIMAEATTLTGEQARTQLPACIRSIA